MLSRSKLRLYTPWRFALNTITEAHQTFNWPKPQVACKILFDTPDMPPKLKLALFSILRSRHLLLCIPSANSLLSLDKNQNDSDNNYSKEDIKNKNSKSPFSATVRAYSNALKAANDLYVQSSSSKHHHHHHQENAQDFSDAATTGARYETASTIGELDVSNYIPESTGMWSPVSNKSASKKTTGRTRLLMQPVLSEEFANYQKMMMMSSAGGQKNHSRHHNNNNNNQHQQEQEHNVKTVTEFDKMKHLTSSQKRNLKQKMMMRSQQNQNSVETPVILEHKNQPKSVSAPPMPSTSRVQLPEVPSLVAEVWSNIESDGILTFVENLVLRLKQEQHQLQQQQQNNFAKNNNNNNGDGSDAPPQDQSTIMNEQHLLLIHNNLLDLRSSAELLTNLFSSPDHLLFDQHQTLDRLTLLALDFCSTLSSLIKKGSMTIAQDEQQQEQEQDKDATQLALSFAVLTANLSRSLRIRGGNVNSAKMTKLLLFAYSLSTTVARFQHVGARKTIPNLDELVLPVRLVAECACGLMRSTSPAVHSVLVDDMFHLAVTIVREERNILLASKNQDFEKHLQEFSEMKERVVKSISSSSNRSKIKNERKEENDDDVAKLEKQEVHLAKVVQRHAILSDNLAKKINTEIFDALDILVRSSIITSEQQHNLLEFAESALLFSERSKRIGNEENKKIENLKTKLMKCQDRNHQEDVVSESGVVRIEWKSDFSPLSLGLHVVRDGTQVKDEQFCSSSFRVATDSISSSILKRCFVVFSKSDIQSKLNNTNLDDVPSHTALFFRWLLHNAHQCASSGNYHSSSRSATTTSPQNEDEKEHEEEIKRANRREAFFKQSSETSSLEFLFGSSSATTAKRSSSPARHQHHEPRTFHFPSPLSSPHEPSIRLLAINPSIFFDNDHYHDAASFNLDVQERHLISDRIQDSIIMQVEIDSGKFRDGEEIAEMLRTSLSLSEKFVVKLEMPMRIVTSEIVVGDESFVVGEAFKECVRTIQFEK